MKIVTMAAQKGGTGKSTTAHNIAAELAATRCRVLVVDMDPLAILTGNFGITPEPGRDMAAVLGDEKPGTATVHRPYPGGLLAPRTPSLGCRPFALPLLLFSCVAPLLFFIIRM